MSEVVSEKNRTWAPMIGLEVHAQLSTNSKMFCRCSAAYAGAVPNTHVCPVCGGMPGALPVINGRAIEMAVLTALALHCTIPRVSKFDRKNYSYPDLPKGYQISQYDMPIGQNGWVEYELSGATHRCGIVRVHAEEDTGKLLHQDNRGLVTSLVDLNRSGVPLMEIVSEPDLPSPEAARAFFATLRQTLIYLGVCDGNLQEGSMRADVNVSVRDVRGAPGTKVEIKNLNSFRAVQRALEHEIDRQVLVLESGGTIEQETRGWNEGDEVTVPQRSKEYAHDYRYFPEPDLPPLPLAPEWVADLQGRMPELPAARRKRLEQEMRLSAQVADVLTADKPLADYFEAVARSAPDVPPATVANWITGNLLAHVNETGGSIERSVLPVVSVAHLLEMLHSGEVTGKNAKTVLSLMFKTGEEPEDLVDRLDLRQITDAGVIERLVDEVLLANAPLVGEYREGKAKLFEVLVGKVMSASRGRADAGLIRTLLLSRLARN